MFHPQSLKLGTRMRLRDDWWPGKAGAVGTVIRIADPITNPHLVIWWHKPQENFSPEAFAKIYPADQHHFDIVS